MDGGSKFVSVVSKLVMRVHLLIAFLAATALAGTSGCRKQVVQMADDNAGAMQCSPLPKYFPLSGESETGALFFGEEQAEWEGMFLAHMQEPSLYNCGSLKTSSEYRFLWDRSLSEPIAVRLVVNPNGNGTLFVRMLNHGGLLPAVNAGEKAVAPDVWYKLKIDKRVDLNTEQVRQVTDMFRTVLHLPTDPRYIGMTTDGSDWIFESRVNGRYRLKDFRNKPPAPARELGLLMALTLAQLPLTKDQIY